MWDFFHDRHLQSNPFVNWMELLGLLLVLWFVMSGVFKIKFIVFGVAACIVISLYCLKAFRIGGLKTDNTYFILHVNFFAFIAYFCWLIKEIIKSALAVTRVIFSGRKKLSPQVAWFRADYDNPAARALLANSITLTPGTVTIDIYDDGVFSVHCLNGTFRDGLLDGTMQKKVAAVFHEEIDYRPIETVETKGEMREMVKLVEKRYMRKKRAAR
jgi:multicomponent Na+:H+ antiporter subunit E